jgi:hypothetical protein
MSGGRQLKLSVIYSTLTNDSRSETGTLVMDLRGNLGFGQNRVDA